MSFTDKHLQVLHVVITGMATALAAWSFRAVFGDSATGTLVLAISIPSAVAIGWGCLIVVLGQRATGAIGTTAAVLSVLVAVAAVTRPGLDVRLGPARLLTGVLPTDAAGPQVATVSALACLSVLFAVLLAARPNATVLPLLPGLCCLLLGLALGAAVAPLPSWYAPALTVASLAAVLTRRRLTRGHLLIGGLVTALAVAAGMLLGPLAAPSRPPANLQALVDVRVTPREQVNPMAQYLALRDGLVPLEIIGTASARTDRVRMATLTSFNGRAWSVSADYRRAGTQFPPAPAGGRDITLDLHVLTPTSVGWLPRAGQPTRISTPGLGFDQDTGDIVVPVGQETPTAYRVVGSERVLSTQELQADDPMPDAVAPGPPLPPDVSAFVDAATSGRAPGLGKFLGLYRAITDPAFRYDVSKEAPGGHGLRQISDLIQHKRGTDEQYASAFAVMCRQLGWDARVVLGFRPTWDGSQVRIKGRDVFAWVEVRFQRLGWVPVDPSPDQTVDHQSRGDAPQQRSNDPIANVPPPDQQTPQEPDGGAPLASSGGATTKSTTDIGTPLLATCIALIMVIGAIPLVKTVHRARARRIRAPRRRAAAAWRDVVNSLRVAGIPVGLSSTVGDVLNATTGRLTERIRPLAEVVDRAAFAPEGVPGDDADLAWQYSDAVRAELRDRTSLSRRVRGLVDLRPLLPSVVDRKPFP